MDGRLTKPQAGILVGLSWMWTVPFTVLPMFKIWGRYIPEGFLTTCSFDFLTEDQDTKVFVACIFVWSYAIPITLISMFYMKLFGRVSDCMKKLKMKIKMIIMLQVRAHEKMLKDQARKMNVKSLVSNQDKQTSVEIRIAKAAFTIFFLFILSWTPYGIVSMIGAFGDRSLLTPLVTMVPALCAKVVSCIDPWIYAISHPRYRQELEKRLPWLGIRESLDENSSVSDTKSTISLATTVAPPSTE